MFGNIAGPSNSSSPTKLPKSPLKKLKASSDSEDAIEITVPSSDVDEDEVSTDPTRLNPQGTFLLSLIERGRVSQSFVDNDLVRCPICNAKVQYKRLNAHMDNNCKDSSAADNTSVTWSRIMARPNMTQQKGKNKYVTKASWYNLTGETEVPGIRKKAGDDDNDEYPIPKASYGTLKDKQLRDMLREYGLPGTGDRSVWEQRHQQYVHTVASLHFYFSTWCTDGLFCTMPIWIVRQTIGRRPLSSKRT